MPELYTLGLSEEEGKHGGPGQGKWAKKPRGILYFCEVRRKGSLSFFTSTFTATLKKQYRPRRLWKRTANANQTFSWLPTFNILFFE